MASRESRSALIAIILFAVGAVILRVVAWAQDDGHITHQTEAVLRLLAGSAILIILIFFGARATTDRSIRFAIYFGCAAAFAGYILTLTERQPSWQDVPIFGLHGTLHRILKVTSDVSWRFAVLYIVFASVRSIQKKNQRLTTQVEELERTRRESSRANSHLQQALAELQTAQQQLLEQERLRAIGEMSSGFVHDLNNALTPLNASSELLSLSIADPSPRQKELLALLERSVLDVSAIVERIQAFHQRDIDARQRSATDLKELVSQVVSGTRAKWKVEPELNGSIIDVRIDADHICAEVDATEIRTVLTNLLFNAVNSMPQGGLIQFRVKQEGQLVCVSVRDSGEGMTADQLQRCTEPLYTTRTGGSGLGLPMCQRVLESYNSTLEFESIPGEGTTAKFLLPTCNGVDSPPVVKQPTQLECRRVLLVEDDDHVRRAVLEMLRQLGVEVESAVSGAEAISISKGRSFDLVITDFGMPEENGAEVIRQIREIHPNMKVAVLSGWRMSRISDRFHADYQPDAVLTKPVTLKSLQTLIAQQSANTSSIEIT